MIKLFLPNRIHHCRLNAADISAGVFALTLGAAALFGYVLINDEAMRILLWPHAKTAEIFYHIKLLYQNGTGYVALGRDFIIGPNCMGLRFIVMLFCMVICVFTRRFRGIGKILFFIISLAGAVIIGVLVSCIRIIGSIPITSSGQFAVIHTGTGVVIYLVTLAGVYILLDKAAGGYYEKS